MFIVRAEHSEEYMGEVSHRKELIVTLSQGHSDERGIRQRKLIKRILIRLLR